MYAYTPKSTTVAGPAPEPSPITERRGRAGTSNEEAKERLRRATADGVVASPEGAAPEVSKDAVPAKAVSKGPDPSSYEGWSPVSGGLSELWSIPPLGTFSVDPSGHEIVSVDGGKRYSFDPKSGKVYDAKGTLLAPKAVSKGPDRK